MKWITREYIRTDRVASAWLIRNFVVPYAQFLFVPRDQVLQVAQKEQAVPFHVPEAELGQHNKKTALKPFWENTTFRIRHSYGSPGSALLQTNGETCPKHPVQMLYCMGFFL